MVNSTTSVLEHMIDDLLVDDSEKVEDSLNVDDSLSVDDSLNVDDSSSIDDSQKVKDSLSNKENEDVLMDAIQLDGECSIYEITQLHQKIHDNWQGKTALNLDVSGVTEVDASFVQLLASCRKEAQEKHQQFELINPSEPLLKRITAMFMDDFFFSEEASETTSATTGD
ncbi:MAG: STAS domain-containing protein [Gammaproteobacteria bacterium]|nr:STAS domain-containing protein [Gammaproteobacteria bacterium]